MSRLPKNWEITSQRVRWTPEGSASSVESNPGVRALAKQFHQDAGDTVPPDGPPLASHLLTLPSLAKWRKYWTESGQQSCGGWFLRHVSGFVNDD